MDQTGVNAIAHLAVAAERAQHLDTAIPAALVGREIISLEHLAATRSRYRGAYSTSSLPDFIKYLQAGGDRTYVDPATMSAKAVLNEENVEEPGHCDWTATLRAVPTAPFKALIQVNKVSMSQRELVAWLEDWASNLYVYGTTSLETRVNDLAAAIKSIREMKIDMRGATESTVSDVGARTSVLSEIEAKSKSGVLPEGFKMMCVPYLGLSTWEFNMRLIASPGKDEKPELRLRVVGLEQAFEDIADQFAQKIRAEVAMEVFIGSFVP